MKPQSYLYSHMDEKKGIAYEHYYADDPWVKYLWLREQEVLRRIIREFYPSHEVRLLDFACGTGRILSALEGSVSSSFGIDVSESMLDVAKTKLRNSGLILGNLLNEKHFESETFDLITAFRFFVNAEPEMRIQALQALHPLLKQEGYLVFNNHHNRYSIRRSCQRWTAALKSRPCNVNFLTIQECHDLAEKTGFEIVKTYSVGLLHVPKIALPPWIYQAFDRFVGECRAFAQFSESPVFVCRKK